MNTHCDIPPFRTWVENRYFYNMEQVEADPLTRCAVFAVSSYQGQEPTFLVRTLREGGVFHYIPVRALQHSKELKSGLAVEKLCYHNCPDFDLVANDHIYLNGHVVAFFRDGENMRSLHGQYLLTIDWPRSNQNMHLVAVETGQYAWLPSHKLLFRSKQDKLPPYKKLRQQFYAGA